jgi:predicted SAM-dependent methyltransferase
MMGPRKIVLLTAGRDIASCTGIEIGPRDSPLILKSAAPVLYADYADAATIRANLHSVKHDRACVVDVDIVTGGRSLAAVAPARVDYVIASHVAEHVPDLLGWLFDVHAVLKGDGTLGLAIPDRRFTFDRFRRESTIAEAVEAYLLQATRPSLRQVFDSAWPAVEIGVDQAWRNAIVESASAENRLNRLKLALELVKRLKKSGAYNDAHCWVFTPASFLDLLDQAARMDLLPYTLQVFHPTELHGYEFFAVLRRADGDHAAETLASIATARAALENWPAEKAYEDAHAPPDVTALQQQNAALRKSLCDMQSSRFWRVTAPVRKILEWIRG